MRAALLIRARWQALRHVRHLSAHLLHLDLRDGAHAAHLLRSTGNRMFAKRWTKCKVSWHAAPNLSTLRVMVCTSCCLLAASALGLLPSAPSGKSDYHSCTTGSLECRAPACPPRWQDASSWRRRRIHSASGGVRVPRRAPVAIWSHRPCSGVVRGCAWPVQRSPMYV